MTSIRDLYQTFFFFRFLFIFLHDLKLNILSYHAEHPKELISIVCYCTTLFYNSKISIPNESASLFGQMTSVWGQRRPTRRSQASKAPFSPASNRSDNKDDKDPLGSNKPWLSKAPIRSFKALTGPFEALAGPLQAPLAQDPSAYCYSQ